MTDFIEIEDLLVRAIVGVNPEERTNRQDVLISIRLQANLRPAGRSDLIDDAVNYRTITKNVISFVEQSSYFLVEKLAEEVAQLCLKDPRVERVRVHLTKPGALRFARNVGVCIERDRNDRRSESSA